MVKMMKTIKKGLAEIHEHGTHSFYVGKILYGDKDYVFFENVSNSNDFDGLAIVSMRNVSMIKYSSKCISFYSCILADKETNYCFANPKELIEYCFKRKRVVEISTNKWGRYVEALLILDVHGNGFVGQRINRNGDLQKKMEIEFDEIDYLLFDSICLKNYEKYLFIRDNNC